MDDESDYLNTVMADATEDEVTKASQDYTGELQIPSQEVANKIEKLFFSDYEGKKITPGGRHAALKWCVRKMYLIGYPDLIIKQKARYFDDLFCDPPKHDPGEIDSLIQWAHGLRQGVPVNSNRSAKSLESSLTDVGNARRMLNAYEGDILYDAINQKWMLWECDEGKWVFDEKGKIKEMVKNVILKIKIESEDLYLQAKNSEDEPEKKELEKKAKALYSWWHRCQFPERLGGCLKILSTYESVSTTPSDFNRNIYLFNCKNGTLDLSTMTFRDHNRDDRITMSCGMEYNPDAKCPEFEKFIERIFLNHPEKKELILFCQTAYGSCLSGDTSIQKIFMPTGSGGNGKTVMAKTMLQTVGDYGKTIASSSLTTKMSGKVRDDLAYLVGVRLAVASEVAPGSVLDEEIVKQLAGGDYITCRNLYGRPFPLKPELKLFWSFNNPPATNDMTKGLWDRIRMIPHEETIRGTADDVGMEVLLKLYYDERSGILNWLIRGYHNLKTHGLPICNAVTVRTQEYKDDSDKLHEFFEEELFVWVEREKIDQTKENDIEWLDYKHTLASDVWNAYLWRCHETHERYPLSHRTFGIKMKEKIGAVNCKNSNGVRYYMGIKLKHHFPVFDEFWKKKS